jgi:DNA-binding NarL/FixJ family response regulator
MSTTDGSKLALEPGLPNDRVQEQLIAVAEFAGPSQGNGRIDNESGASAATLHSAAAAARAAVGEAAYAAAVAAARALAVAEVLDEALAALENTRTALPSSSSTRTSHFDRAFELSPREREVLALVAEGRSNKAIADELFVSPNTVKTHVASLLHKLHADTRVQLATLAAREGLG